MAMKVRIDGMEWGPEGQGYGSSGGGGGAPPPPKGGGYYVMKCLLGIHGVSDGNTETEMPGGPPPSDEGLWNAVPPETAPGGADDTEKTPTGNGQPNQPSNAGGSGNPSGTPSGQPTGTEPSDTYSPPPTYYGGTDATNPSTGGGANGPIESWQDAVSAGVHAVNDIMESYFAARDWINEVAGGSINAGAGPEVRETSIVEVAAWQQMASDSLRLNPEDKLVDNVWVDPWGSPVGGQRQFNTETGEMRELFVYQDDDGTWHSAWESIGSQDPKSTWVQPSKPSFKQQLIQEYGQLPDPPATSTDGPKVWEIESSGGTSPGDPSGFSLGSPSGAEGTAGVHGPDTQGGGRSFDDIMTYHPMEDSPVARWLMYRSDTPVLDALTDDRNLKEAQDAVIHLTIGVESMLLGGAIGTSLAGLGYESAAAAIIGGAGGGAFGLGATSLYRGTDPTFEEGVIAIGGGAIAGGLGGSLGGLGYRPAAAGALSGAGAGSFGLGVHSLSSGRDPSGDDVLNWVGGGFLVGFAAGSAAELGARKGRQPSPRVSYKGSGGPWSVSNETPDPYPGRPGELGYNDCGPGSMWRVLGSRVKLSDIKRSLTELHAYHRQRGTRSILYNDPDLGLEYTVSPEVAQVLNERDPNAGRAYVWKIDAPTGPPGIHAYSKSGPWIAGMNNGRPGGHFIVIEGFDPASGSLYVWDPARGGTRYVMSMAEFMKYWEGVIFRGKI